MDTRLDDLLDTLPLADRLELVRRVRVGLRATAAATLSSRASGVTGLTTCRPARRFASSGDHRSTST
ncbi:hypothetical protein ACFC7A_19375 [Streptomyces niveus]|uniref:hypothetical protein n=1 Tax=Streptomyces niveus TaxID=193462 RepID=UPI0035E0C97C